MTDILRRACLERTVSMGLAMGGHRGRAATYKPKVGDPQYKPILLTPWGLGLQMSKMMRKNNFLLLKPLRLR